MSKPDAGRLLRRNEAYIACSRHLDSVGLTYDSGWGTKHPFIVVNAAVGPLRFSIVGTPSDHRSARNSVRDLKRMLALRGGKATQHGPHV